MNLRSYTLNLVFLKSDRIVFINEFICFEIGISHGKWIRQFKRSA